MILNWIKTLILLIATLIYSFICFVVAIFDRRGKFYSFWGRLWGKTFVALAGLKIDVKGLENLKDANPAIIMINHEAALDIPVSVAILPLQLRYIFKQELVYIPLFGWALWLGRNIPINRSNPREAIKKINQKSGAIINRGFNIIISPEGTRSEDGKIGILKKGGFRIAQQYDIPIISMTMIGNRYLNPKKSMFVKPGKLLAVIDKAVKVSDFDNLNDCVDNVRTNMVNAKKKYEEAVKANIA